MAEVDGRPVAFLPRHGEGHAHAPHRIPYRANVWALRHLGVRRVIAPCAAGSLQRHVEPGHFVVCDQIVDRTRGRGDTFFEEAPVTHVGFADPYCPQLRPLAVAAAREEVVAVHGQGTVVVIEGPRFSTRAESAWFTKQGWEVVNMTQYPESVLCREAEMCYVNISLITDYDAGFSLDSGIEAVTVDAILSVFRENNERLIGVLRRLIASVPPGAEASCKCRSALDGAQV